MGSDGGVLGDRSKTWEIQVRKAKRNLPAQRWESRAPKQTW